MSNILKLSDEEVMNIARQLRVGYGLKRTLRYNTTRDFLVHNESVAEHIFALEYLADYFVPAEVLPPSFDEARMRRIIRYHDFPELKHGDIPYPLKTAELEERERAAARGVFDSLPEPIRSVGYESWQEYEEREILEAKFAYALDKMEPCFEFLDSVNEQTPIRLKQSYASHITKKLVATEEFPVMRRFVVVMSEDMLRRNVFWAEESAK